MTRIYNVDVNVECLYELKSNVSLAEGFVVQGICVYSSENKNYWVEKVT